jgi:hypothetical protein
MLAGEIPGSCRSDLADLENFDWLSTSERTCPVILESSPSSKRLIEKGWLTAQALAEDIADQRFGVLPKNAPPAVCKP